MYLEPEQLIEVVRLTPLVSIDMIVRDAQDRVLLGQRLNRPAQNTWFVPGGRILKDERLDQALERISSSELGRTLQRDRFHFLGVYEHLYPDNFLGRDGVGTHYVVLAHEIVLTEPALPEPDGQHRRFRWWSIRELREDSSVHDNTKAYFV